MRNLRYSLLLGTVLLLSIGLSVSWTDHHTDATLKTDTELRNKAIVHRVFTEALNNGNFGPLEKFVSTDFVRHGNPEITGVDGIIGLLNMYRNAFPDMTITFEDQIADGDRVASRWTAIGTNTAQLQGIPPTGKQVTVSGISIERIKDGKIVEQWEVFDELGMLKQMGLIPG